MNRRTTQITLVSVGIFLIVATYLLYPNMNKKKVQKKVDKNITTFTDDQTTNTFENVEYKGLYDIDKPFTVKSEKAYILKEDKDLVYMTNMHVTLYLDDGRTVIITSNKGSYNKLTYDCFFEENVKATDGETKIFAENLDLLTTKDYASVYNDVDMISEEGSLKADKVDYNFQTRYYKISMFDDKSIKMKIIK